MENDTLLLKGHVILENCIVEDMSDSISVGKKLYPFAFKVTPQRTRHFLHIDSFATGVLKHLVIRLVCIVSSVSCQLRALLVLTKSNVGIRSVTKQNERIMLLPLLMQRRRISG